ncbi:phosphorus acquisition-controlling protein [Colletotrichum tofieldiae]|uniref:Phosphorus acquisition-controlling protein n=1 Tax=Colletotrichum tofieldiae TaxID=708197 RepID=A0A166N7K5_9PEZI|nr:phosphorus acquisition-controlling protein [Colletotrichum tofieldiae]
MPRLHSGKDYLLASSRFCLERLVNILEGNTVPGVTYPSEMLTNLTLKRASHKLAEQGRRNRFNLALEDIASLLPQALDDSMIGENDEKTSKSARVGGPPNSKANIVELALRYIRQLKKEVADANKRAVAAENKLGLEGHQCEKKPSRPSWAYRKA